MFLLANTQPEGCLLISVIITAYNSQYCHCRFQSLEEIFAARKLVKPQKAEKQKCTKKWWECTIFHIIRENWKSHGENLSALLIWAVRRLTWSTNSPRVLPSSVDSLFVHTYRCVVLIWECNPKIQNHHNFNPILVHFTSLKCCFIK